MASTFMNPLKPSKSTPKIGSQNWFMEIPETKCRLGSKLVSGPTFEGLLSPSLNLHELYRYALERTIQAIYNSISKGHL